MLCGGVAACHRYAVCTVLCVLFVVLSATDSVALNTTNSTHNTVHTAYL